MEKRNADTSALRSRTGSHATKGSARGDTKRLHGPATATSLGPVEQRDAYVERIKAIDAECIALNRKLRITQPHAVYQKLQERRNALGAEKIALQGKLSDLNGRLKEIRAVAHEPFLKAFLTTAHAMLPPHTFSELMEKAHLLVQQMNHEVAEIVLGAKR